MNYFFISFCILLLSLSCIGGVMAAKTIKIIPGPFPLPPLNPYVPTPREPEILTMPVLEELFPAKQ